MRLGGGGMWRDYVYELGARMQTATSQRRGVEMYKGLFEKVKVSLGDLILKVSN